MNAGADAYMETQSQTVPSTQQETIYFCKQNQFKKSGKINRKYGWEHVWICKYIKRIWEPILDSVVEGCINVCIPEIFNTIISPQLFEYTISFVNSQR